jgi:hypothetical protein
MKGPTSDRAREMLSALVDELEVDPTELGKKALKVWRARSPALVMKSEERRENPVATATEFMEMLLGSLRSDTELNWSHCEQSSREYGRLRARQGVPLESLIGELAVYRRATIELISNPLQESSHRDGIVALAQSRLEDVTDHVNQSIAAGYLDCVEAGRPQRSRLVATASFMGRRSSYLAQAARNALGKTIAALRLGPRGPWLKAKMVHLGNATRRIARSARIKDSKRWSTYRHQRSKEIGRSRT